MSESMRHPDDNLLQDLAAGALDAGDAAVVQSHLSSCARCTRELATWQALVGSLEGLPRFAPADDFADRIMARVDVRPMWMNGTANAWARLAPRSAAAWALVAAFLAVPALVYGGTLAWLTSRPWFSTAWAVSFVQDTLVVGYMASREWLMARLTDTALTQWVAQIVTSVEPGALGAAAALFGTAIVVSAWVLYRNLIRTPTRERGHATFAF